jgi:hypothetical protein
VEESATSDAEGLFEITARRAGSYAVFCDASGFARAEVSPLEVDPARGLEGIEIHLGPGGTIEGRVLVPSGRDPGGVVVGITRHDGHPRTLRTGPDGAFRFDGLTPGGFEVRRVARELDPSSTSSSYSGAKSVVVFPTDCVVEEGRVTRFDLDLRLTFDVILVAHVSMDGRPAAGWTVRARPVSSREVSEDVPGGTVDELGRARVTLPTAGLVRAELRAVAEEETPLELSQELELSGGETPWIVDLVTGTVEGRSQPRSGLTYTWLDGGSLHCTVRMETDSAGRFRLERVPVGRARIVFFDADMRTLGDQSIEVEKGRATTVELP